jgi:hypothetical protein
VTRYGAMSPTVRGRKKFVKMPDPFSSERTLVILKCVNKVPSLAACSSCQRKFFTLATYRDDPARAEQYLQEKFVMHRCLGVFRRAHPHAGGSA